MGKLRGNPEKDLQKSIVQWINIYYPTIKLWIQPSTGTFSFQKGAYLKRNNKYEIKGISDILGILPSGLFLAIEVKIKPNKPTEEQIHFINMINGNGGLSFVAYSIENVESIFNMVRNQYPHILQPSFGSGDRSSQDQNLGVAQVQDLKLHGSRRR